MYLKKNPIGVSPRVCLDRDWNLFLTKTITVTIGSFFIKKIKI